jgi:hypothetical protein
MKSYMCYHGYPVCKTLRFATSDIIHVRERVTKSVTNGSKTCVMDVIDFLFVSLGTRQFFLIPNRINELTDLRPQCFTSCLKPVLPEFDHHLAIYIPFSTLQYLERYRPAKPNYDFR